MKWFYRGKTDTTIRTDKQPSRLQLFLGAIKRVKAAATSSAPRATASILAVIVVGSVVFPLILAQKAEAYNQYVQDDWSGGVGTDPQTQYSDATNVVPADGSVTIGGNDPAGWCNTANCDTNWTARKLIYFRNGNNQDYTDYQIRVTINTDTDMSNDFADLRFTNEAGDTDYSYYIEKKTDGQSATVLVKIPVVTQWDNKFYVYFGNNAATTLSSIDATMIFWDHFSEEVDDDVLPYWGEPATVFEDSIAKIPAGSAMYANSPYNDIDNAQDTIAEFDYTLDMSNVVDCSNGGPASYMKVTNDGQPDPDAVSIGFHIVPSNTCGSGGQWYLNDWSITHHNETGVNFNWESSAKFNSLQFVRFRIVNHSAGGVDLYYSTDDGVSYTAVPSFNGNNLQQNLSFLFNHDYAAGQVKNLYVYKSPGILSTPNVGTYQWQVGRHGTLVSSIIDMGDKAYFDKVHLVTQNNGRATVRIRSSADANMNGAITFDDCNDLADNTAVSDSTCATPGDRYFQYQLVLSDSGSHDLAISSITIDYDNDTEAPGAPSNVIIKDSPTGSSISNGAWTRDGTPYFSWTEADDNPGGSGIKGYCVYLGEQNNADPLSESGQLTPVTNSSNYQGDDVGGVCPFATFDANLDTSISNIMLNTNLEHSKTYYLLIKSIDFSGNFSDNVQSLASVKIDTVGPVVQTLFDTPAITNTKDYRITWLTAALATDEYSGLAGLKYCVSNAIIGMSGCGQDDQNWYGLDHGSGDIHDSSDVIPFANGQVTFGAADYARLDDVIAGVNAFSIVGVDNAGNVTSIRQGIFLITHTASDAPSNLTVNPSSNSANSFAFTWNLPAVLYGSPSETEYCWTVNEEIDADGGNCNVTGVGITQLAAGPYATQQGVNIFRIATKDVTGNFDNTKYAAVAFSASTIAPGAPQDLEIADVSIRATSTWKMALSWAPPTQTGSGIATYKIMRSTDNSSYSQVGSTSSVNTSFIDSGLSQQLYYYKIIACDSANSCSVASNVVSKTPTGRYTSPARLTADTDQPKVESITTRKAVVKWFTERSSDSRIAIGKSTGNYSVEEIGNSDQVTAHTINLVNLEPGTTYYFIARWTDEDGNTGVSIERTFRTAPAPTISEVEARNLTVSSANIVLTSQDASKIKLYYGKNETFGGAKEISTSQELSTYTLALADLQDGTKYFFKLNGIDEDGNEYQGNVYSLTTPARPQISNLRIETVDGAPSSTKKIRWNTNVPATSQVSYAPINGQNKDALNSQLVTDHEIVVQGLEDDTNYTLTAQSRDADGNVATSPVQSFKTAIDTRPPKVSDVIVETSVRGNGNEAKGQVVVSWKTDEPSTSQIAYGIGQNGTLNNRTPIDNRLGLEHTMIISNLAPSSIYNLQVLSQDKSSNSGVSDVQTAIIGRPSENVFTIIYNALQSIFGVGK